MLRFARHKAVPRVVLGVLTLSGAMILLFSILDGWLTTVGLVGLGLLIVVWIWPAFVVRWLGAVVVAVLVLLALNAAWAALGLERPSPVPGVIAAGAVITLVVWVYCRSWWPADSRPKHAWISGGVVAVVLVVIVPVGIGLDESFTADDPKPSAELASQLEVIVIGGRGRPPSVQPASVPHGWDIDYFEGRTSGKRVDWIGRAPPPPREDADRVLVLAVDGAPRTLAGAERLADVPAARGEVGRWLEIAGEVPGSKVTPTFALLQTRKEARLAAWQREFMPRPRKRRSKARRGGVRSLQALAGPRTLGDVALRLAVSSPTADEDLALAGQHRPLLLFDRGEPTPRPLNVESLLASGEFKLCGDRQLRMKCGDVHSWRDLKNGANRLAFDTKRLAGATPDSAVYVNATRHLTFGRDLVYLDYWWYLPDNPTNAGDGALCGAGLIIPETTCFDHQSDWEGVTVAVDPNLPQRSPPVAVHYAAHEHRTRYTWEALQHFWEEKATVRAIKAAKVNPAVRPVIFIARGTHAAYPSACLRAHCSKKPVVLKENRHGGDRPWPGNSDAACNALCYSALPTRSGGEERAEWHAFDGRWGTTRCQLRFFCSSANAPRGPGTQTRYKRPWCATRAVTLARGKITKDRRPSCPVEYH